MAERAIEAFDQGILIQLARLNISQRDPSVRTPTRQAVGEEFRAIVRIETIWVSVNFDWRMGTSWLR